MKTKLILLLLCISSLNVMGFTDVPPKGKVQGTITRKNKQATGSTSSKPKQTHNTKPTSATQTSAEAAGYDVTFTCNVPSASLYIDGNANGSASGTRFLKTGNHDIKVAATGYEDYIITINVSKSDKAFSFSLTELDRKAIYSKGEAYYNNKDYIEAVKWYRKAADKGYSDAQNSLGVCYHKGQGVTQDYAEAAKWFRKAAEQGNTSAQNKLGYCYDHGQGVKQDHFEAVKWYRKAAEQGNASAQYNLGVCYLKGQGVTQNDTEAIKWYKRAARQGEATAQGQLRKLGITEW